jgi:hypothetical protein
MSFVACDQSVPNPVGQPRKHMMAILLRSDHYVIAALQSAHIEERGIRDAKAGVHHQFDQVFNVLTGPGTGSLSVLVLAAHVPGTAVSLMPWTGGVVARPQDATQLLITERHLVRAITGADRRFDVRTDRRFRDPLQVDGESEEGPEDTEARALRPRTELETRVEQVAIGRRELVDQYVASTVRVFGQLFRERPILRRVAGAMCALSR